MAHRAQSQGRRWRRNVRHAGAGVARYVGNHPVLAGLAGTLVAFAMAGLTLLTLFNGRTDALDHARETSQNLVSTVSGVGLASTKAIGSWATARSDDEQRMVRPPPSELSTDDTDDADIACGDAHDMGPRQRAICVIGVICGWSVEQGP